MRSDPKRWWRLARVAASLLVLAVLVAWQTGTGHSVRAEHNAKPAPLSAELVRAIREGDTKRVAALLPAGADINARDADGNTPLILAALYAGPDCVELLLKRGSDPNAANKAGVTPLIRAAANLQKARLLLAAGAKVQVRTELGNTPLILAARRHGNAPTVRLLLERGAGVTERNRLGISAILAAAASGDLATVQALLDKGADVNDAPKVPNPADEIFAGLRTPLMWAAYRNDLPMLRLLLERGADPNQATALGTPLTHAAWHDSVEAAQVLLDHGAHVNSRDRFADLTALHWAAATDSPRPELVQLLLAKGADPNAGGGDPIDAFLSVPQTPRMFAEKRGATAIVVALKAAGAKAPAPAGPVARPVRALPDSMDGSLLTDAALRAVAALQETAARSREAFVRHASKSECVSCHQQYLPMAAVGHARERSVHVDAEKAAQQIEVIQRGASAFKEITLQVVFHPEPVLSYAYEAFGLASEKVAATDGTDALVHHLATIQTADGRWQINLPRPPIQSSDVTATALAVLAIKQYGWPGRKEEFAARIDRGRQWLWSVKAETNEEAIFQLLGLHWAGESADKLAHLTKALLSKQRADGGWSQLPTLESDAYATGQALYALARAAQQSVSERAWQRGLRFLLQTQRENGSWYVARRAFPFQPTMSSGFPHGRDSWLSAAATSWAVMALTQALDPKTVVAARSQAPRVAPAATASKEGTKAERPVDFVQHIKPVLERSCLACHGPERPRSRFRVDSRAALVQGGNSGEAALLPGQSGRSPLIQYVSGPAANLEMPPPAKRDRFPSLTKEEVQLLAAWIDQGAVWPKNVDLSPPGGEQRHER
jgi:ankyrin repeat protein